MSRRRKKIVKYRRPIRLNIGVIVFLFIFIYIIILSVSFFTKKRVSITEVTEAKIADDNTCKGVIIREEMVVNTKKSGYINYYVGDGSRVAKSSTIYTVDETGTVYNLLSNTESDTSLTSEDTATIRGDIAQLRKNYNGSNYNELRNFIYNINNTVLEFSNINLLSNLKSILKDTGTADSFTVEKTKNSGIVCYTVDGYESLDAKDVTLNMIEDKNYTKTQLRSATGGAVEAGSPAYKLITSEDWTIVLSLTKEQYTKLHKKETEQLKKSKTAYITITLVKEDVRTTVPFSTYTKDNNYYGKLDLSRYLVHYIDDRFIEVELSLNQAEGLKIPKTSIFTKDFYIIPLEYLTVEGKSQSNGVMMEVLSKGDALYEFTPVDIYHEDDQYIYVDTSSFEAGTELKNPNSKDTFTISKTEQLEGVYNVNKGYSVFRRIEKVYENEEYCIVKKDTNHGLRNYDHIIVDAKTLDSQAIANNK